MSKIYLFYATVDDLLPVMRQMESLSPLKYVHFGTVTRLPPESFSSATMIPNLGRASHPSAVACETYLVCAPEISIKPRQLKTLTDEDISRPTISVAGREIAIDRRNLREIVGMDRFAIDQLANPDTITFTPGGLWNDEMLLHGRFATASETQSSQRLLKRFGTALSSEFTKIKAFYVGANAMELLKRGMRLTAAAQSPREFDLSIS